MNYESYHLPNKRPTIIMPLLWSMIVHGAVVAFLLFWQAPTHKAPTAGIETTFFGQGELLAIEGQIRENARLAQLGDEGTDKEATISTPKPSPQMSSLNDELARRQAEFEQQIAKFAAEIDKQALAEQQAYVDELKAQAEQEQAELNEARQAFAKHDEKIKENQKSLDQARAARDDAIAKAEAEKRKQGGQSGSLDSGETASTSSGTNAKTTQGTTSGANKNSIIAALQAIIYRNWQVPNNASGERLQANIRVDGSGNVLGVTVSGGGNAALKDSLENAIMNSSPLSPIVGTEFRELKVNFIAN